MFTSSRFIKRRRTRQYANLMLLDLGFDVGEDLRTSGGDARMPNTEGLVSPRVAKHKNWKVSLPRNLQVPRCKYSR